jgi:hypothetical protein
MKGVRCAEEERCLILWLFSAKDTIRSVVVPPYMVCETAQEVVPAGTVRHSGNAAAGEGGQKIPHSKVSEFSVF